MKESEMRPTWRYKLGQNILSREKKEKALGVVNMQDNFSPEKYIDKIFGICISNVVPPKKKHVLKLERIQRIATKMVSDLEDLTYEERLKEMHLTPKERRERRLNYNI